TDGPGSSAWPRGIRLSTIEGLWWRVDAAEPSEWSWAPYPEPLQRYDSHRGLFRTRYAARTARGALREAFDSRGRVLVPADLRRTLVTLEGTVRVLDLRREQVLDAFALDDRISTARDPSTWDRCHELADLVRGHYGARCDGIVYRSRTTPESSANLAFFAGHPLAVRSVGPLGEQHALLAALVVADRFAILDS
ncbi:MAG: hypothetical protein JWN20_1579, partial [Jatrophihabitantaceae bacterium]|nr:hypothetical protein [Jatrophihabitantaceae bacterium]